MKHIKALYSIVAVAVAFTAFGSAGTASATVLTDGSGSSVNTIQMTSSTGFIKTNFSLHIICEHTYLHGDVTSMGEKQTAKGNITLFTFSDCGANFTMLKGGTFEVHNAGTGSAVVTLTGSEETMEHMGGIHCVFTTNNTSIGTLTGSSVTKGTAVLDVKASIPRTGGRSGVFCGSSMTWEGSLTVTSPDTLNID